MKTATRWATAALAAGGLMAFAPGTAWADPTDAQAVINQYQSEGYQVIIDRSGSLPTNKCTVANVRNGQDRYRTDYQRTLMPGGRWLSLPVQTLDHRIIYISLNCN